MVAAIGRQIVRLIPALLLSLTLSSFASRASATSCGVELPDPADAAEPVVEVAKINENLGSINEKVGKITRVADLALKARKPFASPGEGVTNKYFLCIWDRLRDGRARIRMWDVKEQAASAGPSDMSGKACPEFEKVARTARQDFERMIDKDRKAIETLKGYEKNLTSFISINDTLVSIAQNLFSNGAWLVGWDMLNLEELSYEARRTREAAEDKRLALEKNVETYKAKQINIKSWEGCSVLDTVRSATGDAIASTDRERASHSESRAERSQGLLEGAARGSQAVRASSPSVGDVLAPALDAAAVGLHQDLTAREAARRSKERQRAAEAASREAARRESERAGAAMEAPRDAAGSSTSTCLSDCSRDVQRNPGY